METGKTRKETDSGTREGLLERISSELGCMYLSDLRGATAKGKFRFIVSDIPAMDYSVKVWQDALYYITGIKENFSTAEQAKQRLLEYLLGC
ncbi:hypothetical protein [Lacrimispora sp.]|uniref:hypothetical protein n=1 Tax=Lacrimispora sp. TaxID=2719234 RepID=UPI0029E64CC6|nr:hypothetical protein [Lacrimispora sp.]